MFERVPLASLLPPVDAAAEFPARRLGHHPMAALYSFGQVTPPLDMGSHCLLSLVAFLGFAAVNRARAGLSLVACLGLAEEPRPLCGRA